MLISFVISILQEQNSETDIFVADFNLPVYWGHISMLDAELQCLELLEKRFVAFVFIFIGLILIDVS